MPRLRIHNFALSLDGYGAGPRQAWDHPLGVGGTALHEWAFATRTIQRVVLGKNEHEADGSTGIDDQFIARGLDRIGAWILGRNMFGPVRGPWPTEPAWNGWWGEDPPYHVPVFVLTNHPRPSVTMQGGTTFHFVTEGIHAALRRAFAAAGGRDVRLGGGAATIRQYLQAGLVDEMHVALTPVLLGSGEPLFAGLDLPALGYRCSERITSPGVTHCVLTRIDAGPAGPGS